MKRIEQIIISKLLFCTFLEFFLILQDRMHLTISEAFHLITFRNCKYALHLQNEVWQKREKKTREREREREKERERESYLGMYTIEV